MDIKKKFIKEYSEALQQNNCSIFAGAGISRESGYVNWKELLDDFAKQINLDVNKEYDLISVAQFYKNEMGGNINGISQEILNQFTKNAKKNSLLNLLADLPISSFWTTNYDSLIEETLISKGKRVDIKRCNQDLSYSKLDKDTVVYKFHGDITQPYNAVITRDDYENFDNTHKLFVSALQGELITKTFVFIGYSFGDPDLKQILSKIRILVGENKRNHYCFKFNLERKHFDTEEDYTYACVKQNLEIKDLLRYGIHTILVKTPQEIFDIFQKVYKLYLTNHIFIAGSSRNYQDWLENNAYEFLYNLGYKLIENNHIVSSGFVEGVGPQIVNGALTAISDNNLNLEKHLKIKPLPLINGSDQSIKKEAKKMFQNDMISKAGIIIFVFGNQYYNGHLKNSKGVMHDFKRAKELNRFIIPVASTGYAAKEIFEEMKTNICLYPYLTPFIGTLSKETDPNELVNVILECINNIRNSI